MKQVLIALIVVFLIGLVLFIRKSFNSSIKTDAKPIQTFQNDKKAQINMQITSSAFQNNQNIPQKYTCDGQGVNPALSISNVPDNAKSLALIVEDPDAPSGSFIHWVLYNIKPEVKEFWENQVPDAGKEGLSTTGRSGYVPPCPPSGTHRYIFTLYALDTNLNLPGIPAKSEVEKAIQGHILEQAQLIGLYGRS